MTLSKDAIFTHLKTILEEQFEVPSDAIHQDAQLYEDLDIDSIDAVNLLIELKPLTKTKVSIENFHEVRTVGDVVDAVHDFLQQQADSQPSA